jgi:hypothetical protein
MNKSASDKYSEYLKERHGSYVDQRKRLDANALSVAEKYDQWILTIAGGALIFSLTFLEKIVADPVVWSLPFIVGAWFCFVVSLLVGFLAIHFSAKGLVRQIEILDLEYKHFRETTTPKLPQGESFQPIKNLFSTYIRKCSQISLTALIIGSIFLCIFASINIYSKKAEDKPQKIELLLPHKHQHQEQE